METPCNRPGSRRSYWLGLLTAGMMSGQLVFLPTGIHDMMSLRPPETSLEHKCSKATKRPVAPVKGERTASATDKSAPRSGWSVITKWLL